MTDNSHTQLLKLRSDSLGLEPVAPQTRMDIIISRPDAEAAVQAMEPLDLYHLIRAVGHADSIELASLASPDQLQTFFDLDCWSRDRINASRMQRWLAITLEQPDDRFFHSIHDVDPEIPALFMKEHLKVFLLDDEKQPPPELIAMQLNYEHSLDNVYAIVFPDDEATSVLIHQLLDRLYHVDITLARTLLEATRWELTSNMEEAAFQGRRARLEQLGFVDFYEALSIFAWRDPDLFKKNLSLDDVEDRPSPCSPSPQGWQLPIAFSQADPDQSFFSQALSHFLNLKERGDVITDVQSLMFNIVLLTNKAMAAANVEPGDIDATRRAFARTRGTLAIALEFLSEGSLETASHILDRYHVQTLFQIGFSLVLKLSRHAERLLMTKQIDPLLSITDDAPYSLLSDLDRPLLTHLLKPRPEFIDPDTLQPSAFSSLKQLELTAARLSLLAFRVMLVYPILGLSRDAIASTVYQDNVFPPVESVTINTIIATIFARAAVGLSPDSPSILHPLSPNELADLIQNHLIPARESFPFNLKKRSIAALAPLEDTPLFTLSLNLISATQPSQARQDNLPIARPIILRALEALFDNFAALSPQDLRSGVIEPQFLGQAILLRP